MPSISRKDYNKMKKRFQYKGLPRRWYRLDKIFNIKEGDVVIDGGAFHGDIAIYSSKRVGESGRVYSLEPNALNHIPFYNNIMEFNVDNVILIPMALYSGKSMLEFYIDTKYGNTGSIVSNFRKVCNAEELVRTIAIADSLDNIVKLYKIPKIDFIWLNIEGAEILAIKGMKETLRDNDCEILVSTHRYIVDGKEKNTRESVKSLLKEYGYNVRKRYGYVYAYK